jgi:hypothetical protein
MIHSAARQPLEKLAHTLKSFDHRHRIDQVFYDWLELAAIAHANTCDRAQYAERELRYVEVAKRYTEDEITDMASMTAMLALALTKGEAPLHTLMSRMELGSNAMKGRLGQFYTPFQVSYMMARLAMAPRDKLGEQVKAQGYISFMEPACGAGGMMLAFAQAFEEAGFDPHKQLHITAVDIDIAAVHMTYLQAVLLGLPATVFHGDSLRQRQFSYWLTPRFVADRWDLRLAGKTPEPVPGVARWRIRQEL